MCCNYLVTGSTRQVVRIVRFALDNPKKIAFLSFSRFRFTGAMRDTPQRRLNSVIRFRTWPNDVKDQLVLQNRLAIGFRFPLMGAFADFADLVHGPQAEMGPGFVRLPSKCGVGTVMV